MAKKPETIFKERVQKDIKELRKQGARIWPLKTQMVALRGIPDMLLCVNGEFWAMELKKDLKEQPTPLQAHTLQLIQDAGGRVSAESPETWPSTLILLARAAFGQNKPKKILRKAAEVS